MTIISGVAAVDRALAVLATFDEDGAAISLSELARRASLHKSTALRLLGTLRAHGYVLQTAEGRYVLGPATLRLGAIYQRTNRMDRLVIPALDRLVEAGSESPSFHIRYDAESRLCLFRVNSRHSTVDRVRPGLLLPLSRGAASHVMRALQDNAQGEPFETVRQQGYAISFGETDAHCAAVAAPIYDQTGSLAGVLSLSGPRVRFTETVVAEQLDYALSTARALSAALGGAKIPAASPVPATAL